MGTSAALLSFRHCPRRHSHPHWSSLSPHKAAKFPMYSHNRGEWEGKERVETFGVPGQIVIKATTLGSPPMKTGAASAPWLWQSWPGPLLWRDGGMEGWRVTFLGERKQAYSPGGSAVTKEEKRRGKQGGPDHNPGLLSTAGLLPWAAQQRSLVIWGGRGKGP